MSDIERVTEDDETRITEEGDVRILERETPIFPALYGFSINKRPTFATISSVPRSGREVQRFQNLFPLWEFELRFEVLRDQTQNASPITYWNGYSQLRQVSEFFVGLGGPFGRFFFNDFTDNSRSEQVLGAGDGSNREFTFVRTIDGGSPSGVAFTEPVGGINLEEELTVYVNGVVVSAADYTVSADLTTLVFNVAPGNGFVVSATFHFYYFCRFISDEVDLEQFMTGRWSINSLKFRSINRYGNLLPNSWWSEDPLRVPPVAPTPPEPGAPTLDGASWAINPGASIDLVDNNRNNGGVLVTTYSGYVAVVIMCASAVGFRSVNGITSTSGLTFVKQGQVQYLHTGSGGYENLELWTAVSSGVLTGENISVSLSGGASISMAVIGIKGGTTQGDASMPTPLSDSGLPYPEVSASLSGVSNFMFWMAGGHGINANGIAPDPIGSADWNAILSSIFSVFTPNVNLGISYRRVVGAWTETVEPGAAWRTEGVGILWAFNGT